MPIISLKESKVLTAGIRRNYRAGRNEVGLLELLNSHVNPSGLFPYEAVEDRTLITAGSGVPAVMLFRGPKYIIGFGNDNKFYKLNDGTGSWSIANTYTNAVDPDDVSGTINVASGGNIWHVALFENGWIAANGSMCIFTENNITYYIDDVSYPLSVCEFRGRLFYGGIGRYWTRWNTAGFSASLYGGSLGNFTDSWVGWCSISGRDALQHVWPERGISIAADTVSDEVLDNGDFSDGNTDWTVDTGWVYTTGPNRMVATSASTDLEYAIDASGWTGNYYRVEVDVSVTSGSVGVVMTLGGPGPTEEYIGSISFDTSGNHVFYYRISSPTAVSAITFTGSSFTGTLHSVSVKESFMFNDFSEWRETQKSLQSGFSRSKEQGDVLCVKPLRDHVIVYGENFITAYSPVEIPSPTFGRSYLKNFGIAGRGAVGGGADEHLFMDVSGKLWTLNNQLQFTEVGYQEWFEDEVQNDGSTALVINWDENEELYWITMETSEYSGGRTWLLTREGLSEIGSQIVHSVCGVKYSSTFGECAGWVESGGEAGFELMTDDMDFGSPDMKLFERISIEGDGVDTMTVSLWTKSSQNGNYVYHEGQTPNRDGDVYPCISGRIARVLVSASNAQNVRLYDLKVEFSTQFKHNSVTKSLRRA